MLFRYSNLAAQVPILKTADDVRFSTPTDAMGINTVYYFPKSGKIAAQERKNGVEQSWKTYVTDSDIQIKWLNVNRTSIKTAISSRINTATFFGFYQPTDNPFSFDAGYGIAFNWNILHGNDKFLLIGFQMSSQKSETVEITL